MTAAQRRRPAPAEPRPSGAATRGAQLAVVLTVLTATPGLTAGQVSGRFPPDPDLAATPGHALTLLRQLARAGRARTDGLRWWPSGGTA